MDQAIAETKADAIPRLVVMFVVIGFAIMIAPSMLINNAIEVFSEKVSLSINTAKMLVSIGVRYPMEIAIVMSNTLIAYITEQIPIKFNVEIKIYVLSID